MRVIILLIILFIMLASCKNRNYNVLTNLAQTEIIKADSIPGNEDNTVKPNVVFADLIVKNTVISDDIFELRTPGGVIFQYNEEENEQLEGKTGTNYNELADDINFYSMGVYDLLKKNNLPVYLTDNRFIRIRRDSSEITIDTRSVEGIVGWKVLLVDSLKSPQLFNTTDLDQNKLDAYFTKK